MVECARGDPHMSLANNGALGLVESLNNRPAT